MQVSRIGIGQMMFPGFNRSFGADMTQNRFSWNQPGTPGYGSFGFPGYQPKPYGGGGGEVAAAERCYTCTDGTTTYNNVNRARKLELEKQGFACAEIECGQRGGAYPTAFDFNNYGAGGGMVADASVADSFGSFSGSGMMGRRPLQLQSRRQALGQATKQPLSIAYDDAARMLSSAEAIIAQTQACNLPVIDRFRSYVKAGSKVSNLELTASDGVQLDQFSLCATTKGAQGAVGSAPAAGSSDTLGLIVAGVAAAALIGFMFWKTA